MDKVTIYTDGACSGNPGAGGYAAILIYNGITKEVCGGESETTNNRMELCAVIAGLECLRRPCEVELHSDSKYIIDSITKGWVYAWRKNNWIKSDRKPALNRDLWERLLELLELHKVNYVWVKGHNGDIYNEKCDRLAVEQSEKHKGRN